jgi:hypothetical protein
MWLASEASLLTLQLVSCYKAVNMAVKLENCAEEEQQSVIGFLWAEGVPGEQIHQRMCTQYGHNALPHWVVYEWIEMFKNGHTSVTDAERSGSQITATSAQN